MSQKQQKTDKQIGKEHKGISKPFGFPPPINHKKIKNLSNNCLLKVTQCAKYGICKLTVLKGIF